MTLDELCYTVRRTPIDLERWAALGALGDRWKEPRDRGKWRHISKDAAGRAIIMERLVAIGLKEERAAKLACHYERKTSTGVFEAEMNGIRITVKLDELELP